MLYLGNKDLSPSAQLPPERSYTLGDENTCTAINTSSIDGWLYGEVKNHKPCPLVPNGQGHAHS